MSMIRKTAASTPSTIVFACKMLVKNIARLILQRSVGNLASQGKLKK